MKENPNTQQHFIIRLLILLLPAGFLFYDAFFPKSNGGGNDGSSVDVLLFLQLGLIVLWIIYIQIETLVLFSKKEQKLAMSNCYLIIIFIGLILIHYLNHKYN